MKKKYLVAWTTIANSGMDDYADKKMAEDYANTLKNTKHVMTVDLLEVADRKKVKTRKDWEKQGSVSGF
jgi:hypothetical protein